MNTPTSLLLLTALAATNAATTAQTVTIRGEVDDVSGTQNQFFLEGTTISVVSNVLNLNLWDNQDAIFDVVNIGTPTVPVLRIDAATPTFEIMDMGNLELGETNTWEVFAPAGSTVFIFMDWTANTGFTPLPGLGGAWLLGASPYLLAGGVTIGGFYQTAFTTPNNQALLGLEVSSQALVGTNGQFSFSEVDSKVVEN